MPTEEFEKLVEEGYERLPSWVRERINNVAILIEDRPGREDLKEQGIDPDSGETLLGLYRGIPLTARGEAYGVGMPLPDSITLFKQPIEEAAGGDVEKIRTIVADTVWHEVGHYLGLDEEGVRAKEEEKGIGDFRESHE